MAGTKRQEATAKDFLEIFLRVDCTVHQVRSVREVMAGAVRDDRYIVVVVLSCYFC